MVPHPRRHVLSCRELPPCPIRRRILIGLVAFALLLWTFDVFTRGFWVDDNPAYVAIDEDLDRMARAAREAAPLK